MNLLRYCQVPLSVLALLAAVDLWVGGPFFQRHIQRRYVAPFSLLRDRTAGASPQILFDAMDRLPADAVRVLFVGDSTMNAIEALETSVIPALVRDEIRRTFPGTAIEVVDASEVGMYVNDAALFIDKALGHGADVVVYGVSLRAFPTAPSSKWVTRINEDLSASDLLRLAAVADPAWLRERIDADSALGGIVRAHWSTFAYRHDLRLLAWNEVTKVLPAVAADLEPYLAPGDVGSVPREARLPQPGPYEWTRSEYGPPSSNWEALEVVGRLCRKHLQGRCVLYAGAVNPIPGPVNPLRRVGLAEPGLYEEYLARLRVVAGRNDLLWRDLSSLLAASEFRAAKYGGGWDPIHPNETGRAKIAARLRDPVAAAVGSALRVKAGRPVDQDEP